MVVQHNLTAMNSNRMLGLTTSAQAKSTEKLSSGYKINRAADDAAGLSISEKMRKQIKGLTQASSNAEDGISCVQTAEGALTEVHDMLQRMNELAVKAANGTMSLNDRSDVQDEIKQLSTEVDRVSTTTKFNETYLLQGDKTSGATSKSSYLSFKDAGLGEYIKNAKAGTAAGTYNYDINTEKITSGSSITIGGIQYTVHDKVSKDGGTTAADAKSINGTDVGVDAVKTLIKNAIAKANNVGNTAGTANTQSKVQDTDTDAANVLVNLAKIQTKNDLTLSLHVGADSASDNKISFNIQTMDAEGLGISKLSVTGSDPSNATYAIDNIAEAIKTVSKQRSGLGAVQNRLEHTINNLNNIVENTTSAESSIRDTDMATEMVKYSNNSILTQAGQAMLAQANQSNQGVLSLLQG